MHADHPQLLDPRPIFHILRERGPVLLHHPYQSFATSVGRFVREAVQDPKVRAIKLILGDGDAGPDAALVQHLNRVEGDGKEVALVVSPRSLGESWVVKLRQVGVHISFGMAGLAIGCDALLVVRGDFDGLRRYACLGSSLSVVAGRTDLILLTSDRELGQDLGELFNGLTSGCGGARHYRKLLLSPGTARAALLAKIESVAARAGAGQIGLIRLMLPRLDDPEIMGALQRAANAGVRVELVVPDVAGLRPGENLRIVRVEGPLAEHARLLHFANVAANDYYLSSDELGANELDHNIGLLIPLDDPGLVREAGAILDAVLYDNAAVAEMGTDGEWRRRAASTTGEGDCQAAFAQTAAERQRLAVQLKQQRVPMFARRAARC